jgi:hypothetical protein
MQYASYEKNKLLDIAIDYCGLFDALQVTHRLWSDFGQDPQTLCRLCFLIKVSHTNEWKLRKFEVIRSRAETRDCTLFGKMSVASHYKASRTTHTHKDRLNCDIPHSLLNVNSGLDILAREWYQRLYMSTMAVVSFRCVVKFRDEKDVRRSYHSLEDGTCGFYRAAYFCLCIMSGPWLML